MVILIKSSLSPGLPDSVRKISYGEEFHSQDKTLDYVKPPLNDNEMHEDISFSTKIVFSYQKRSLRKPQRKI